MIPRSSRIRVGARLLNLNIVFSSDGVDGVDIEPNATPQKARKSLLSLGMNDVQVVFFMMIRRTNSVNPRLSLKQAFMKSSSMSVNSWSF